MAAPKLNLKTVTADFQRIAQGIRTGNFASVYLLMGEESYFIDRLAQLLADTVVPEDQRSFNQVVVYGLDSQGGVVANLARQMPMMGSRQLVLVREAQMLSKIEALLTYVRQPATFTVLVLCYKGKSLDKRTPLYKAIAEKGTVFESVKPRDWEINGWIAEYVAAKKLKISTNTIQMLADYMGTDLSKIAGEIDKLVMALPDAADSVTADDVARHIGISREFNVFELTHALAERNAVKSLKIVEYFADNPKNNPMVLVVGRLFAYFQKVFMLNYQMWLAQKKAVQMPSEVELCRAMKLSSPFFLKEYTAAARNYPLPKLFAIMGVLREYDMRQKGIATGGVSDGELMKELILKILTL